jgi:putative ABC transport system permease protein
MLTRIRKHPAPWLTLACSLVMLAVFFLTQPWSLPNFGAGGFPGGAGGQGGTGTGTGTGNFQPPAGMQIPANFTPPAGMQLPPGAQATIQAMQASGNFQLPPGAQATIQAMQASGNFQPPAGAGNATPGTGGTGGSGGGFQPPASTPSAPTAGTGSGTGGANAGGFPGGAGGFPGGAPGGGFFTIVIGVLSNPLVLLVPFAGLLALVMTLWRFARPGAARITSYITIFAGIAALVYYVSFVIGRGTPVNNGFWVAGVAAIGLIGQYPLARRTFPPRTKYVKLSGIPQKRTGFNLNLGQNFAIAFDALMANKLRSALTMLGIIIGVMSVVALLSVGRGAQAAITEQISGTGLNLLTISSRSTGSNRNLTYEDAEALARQLTNVSAVLPQYGETLRVRSDDENILTSVTGVTDQYATANNIEVEYGRFLNAVIGKDAATDLFGGRDPIGKTIRVNGVRFEVIGVLGQQDSGFGGNANSTIYVPLTSAYRSLFNVKAPGSTDNIVSSLRVAVNDLDGVNQVKSEIERILRERHKLKVDEENDFNILDQQSLLNTANTITGILTVLLGAIASVSLLVGGIGIMNISLVSVTERTKEIGLRKAVGARKNRILMQFLIETIFLSTLGGVIGVILGVLTALLVNASGLLTARITADSILLGLGFSMIVGVFFGVYPATRAASLQPIEALRYE